MLKLTVSRDDRFYEGFPDIARTPNGTLVCVYRQTMGHGAYPFSRLAVRRSTDGGRSWTDAQIAAECGSADRLVDHGLFWLPQYAVDIARGIEWKGSLNCPRLICLQDGSLLLMCDWCESGAAQTKAKWINYFWRSTDEGQTWAGPEQPTMPHGLVPGITQLRSGDLLVGLCQFYGPNLADQQQLVCRSTDGGKTFTDSVVLPNTESVRLDETDFVELDDGTIVAYHREDFEHAFMYRTISRDGGRTWSGPYRAQTIPCLGRPSAGLLRSGEVCVTFRSRPGLTLYVESQAEAVDSDPFARPRALDPDDTLRSMQQTPERHRVMPEDRPITFVIDHDRSPHCDFGYSGWVQLDNGDLYVVDYINDDAPQAQIRGYVISRSDWYLFPEGQTVWVHPGAPWFERTRQELAQAQRDRLASGGDQGAG